ncbi:hypothetical protein ACJMK2_013090 [Sinanodonta woodiana]|uniref:Prokineticin domain-containing protein n=1 Tax=Sinanodonta woodiana TaxID=1069815 RepID=A0ABD3VA93_SINWO
MVSLFIGILFFIHFTQAIPATDNIVLVRYCDSNADCASDECCVTNAQLDGKRFLSTLGTCQKLGTESSRCLVSSHLTPSSGMYYVCPCASGFKCHGTGQYDVPLGEIGSCQGPSIRTRQTCQSGADCAADECCVSDVRPIGRRRRELFGAHCQKMGVDGSNCYVRYGSGKPNGTVFAACPCTSGLTCVGNHIYDVPLGEMGSCTK